MWCRIVVVILTVVACGVLPEVRGQDDKKLPPLNEKVLAYCVSQKGKQVGNGECWTLADLALGAAGAHRPGEGGYATYVFGRALKADEAILPGDIVQFDDAKFVTTTATRESIIKLPLHTGIVSKVDGTKIEMLNQNTGDARSVVLTQFDRKDLKAGKVQFFRPQPVK